MLFGHRDELATLARAYAAAAKACDKAAAALDRALDALARARGRDSPDPDDCTRARMAAMQADHALKLAWTEAETARQAYWARRTADLDRRLVTECLPLFVQHAAYRRWAGLPSITPDLVLRHHMRAAQVHVEPASEVPIDPLPTPALDRADDEIVTFGL